MYGNPGCLSSGGQFSLLSGCTYIGHSMTSTSTIGDGRSSPSPPPLPTYRRRRRPERPSTTTVGSSPKWLYIYMMYTQCYFDRWWRSSFTLSSRFTKFSEEEKRKDDPYDNSRYPPLKTTLISVCGFRVRIAPRTKNVANNISRLIKYYL